MQYRVKIYQINSDRDKNRVIFAGSDYLMKNEPALNIDASIYDEVFSGELDTKEPEKLFAQFNLERHPLHRGHSMSVSDVIVTEDGAFFCDSVGFKRIRFDESKTQKAFMWNRARRRMKRRSSIICAVCSRLSAAD